MLRKRPVQDRGDQLDHHVSRFRRSESIQRRNHAERRIAPAQQAFRSHDLAQPQIILRLEDQVDRISATAVRKRFS
jgi:hypothetical protein